jgi:hypothetical protein
VFMKLKNTWLFSSNTCIVMAELTPPLLSHQIR